MSTKSFIGRVEPDGCFLAHPVTYDGYPAGVGASLAQLLACSWARGRPSRVLAELGRYRSWWSIGPDLPGPTRVGHPDDRSGEQDWPLVAGRVGRTCREFSWGYLFRGEDELLVVRRGHWWQSPPYPVQRWARIPVEVIARVEWERLGRTAELHVQGPLDDAAPAG